MASMKLKTESLISRLYPLAVNGQIVSKTLLAPCRPSQEVDNLASRVPLAHDDPDFSCLAGWSRSSFDCLLLSPPLEKGP